MGGRRKRSGRAPPTLGGRLGRVYEADHGICHLCHLPVPTDVPEFDPRAPTVDHLKRPPKGTPYHAEDETNLRLAHRLCNSRRGNRPMSELSHAEFDNIWRE